MLINEIETEFKKYSTNLEIIAFIKLSNDGQISIVIPFDLSDEVHTITLSDELINFAPLLMIPSHLPPQDWECSITLDKVKTNEVLAKFENKQLHITYMDNNFKFNLSGLKFSQKVLGNAVYKSLNKQLVQLSG